MNPQHEDQPVQIREMTLDDYPALMTLWHNTPGICPDEEDSPQGMAVFLARNPGLSFVAEHGGQLIATIKGAQDGRRGYISHMAVANGYRRRGLAAQLIGRVESSLLAQGIRKCNLYVLDSNEQALAFWHRAGWQVLHYDFRMLQKRLAPS